MPGPKSRSWQLLDWAAIPALSAIMYAAWAVPLANALLDLTVALPERVVLPAWLPLLMLLGGSYLARHLEGRRAGGVIAAIVGLVAVVTSLAFLVPRPSGASFLGSLWTNALDWKGAAPGFWLLALVLGLTWLRALSVDWLDPYSLRRAFFTGVVGLGLLLAVRGYAYGLGIGLADGTREAAIVMVVSGLSALALADLSRTLHQSLATTGAAPPLGRYWLGLLALVMAGVLALSWLVALVVAPDAVVWLGRWLSPVLNVIGTVLLWAVAGIAYVVFLLLGPLLQALMRTISETPVPEAESNPSQLLDQLLEGQRAGQGLPDWVQYAAAAVLLLAVAGAFALALRRRTVVLADGVVESREIEWSPGMLREQLRRWLRSLRHGVHLLPLNEPQASRAAVRSAYRRVLSLAYEQGLARKPGQTPQDYATALAAVAPRLREPLCVLTEAYDAARYAPSPPGATEVAAARAASAEIEALLFAHETERAPQAPDQAPGNLKAG